MRALALLLCLAGAAFAKHEVLIPGLASANCTIVITGDGWQQAQLDREWPDTVNKVLGQLWGIAPFNDLKHIIRVIRIDVPSESKGCAYEEPPYAFRKELGYEFDAQGNLTKSPPEWTPAKKKELQERKTFYGLKWPRNAAAPKITAAHVKQVLDEIPGERPNVIVFITPDQEVANAVATRAGTPRTISMNTVDEKEGSDFAGRLAHELAHSMFLLGDEYGGNAASVLSQPYPNVTNTTDHLKWRHLGVDTAYPGGEGSDDNFHPTEVCRMRLAPYPPPPGGFCKVCLYAISEAASSKFKFIRSSEPDGSVLGKYTATGEMRFKVVLNGNDKSDYKMTWTLGGKKLDTGTVSKGPDSLIAELVLRRPPLMYGVHKLTFLVEQGSEYLPKGPGIQKAPQTREWWLTVVASNPIVPLPGVDWTWP